MSEIKPTQTESNGVNWRMVAAIAIGAFVVWLLFYNSDDITLQIFPGVKFSLPLWVWLLGFYLAGVLTAGLVKKQVKDVIRD